jgi:hexosaminidase
MTNRRWLSLLAFPVILGFAPRESRAPAPSVDLSVIWNLETNFADGGGHRATFTIRNQGDTELTDDNWAMYWSMAPREIDQASITAPVTVEWISGDFYRMEPTDGFRLPPGAEITIRYQGRWGIIKESDAPVGLYVVFEGGDGHSQPYPVDDYVIAPFEGREQIDRGPGDQEPIPTAEWLFEQQASIAALPDDQVQLIVPMPQSLTRGSGTVTIDASTTVLYDSGLHAEARMLGTALDGILDGTVTVSEGVATGGTSINLRHRDVDVPGSYRLTASADGGVVIAGDPAGVFYGTQSLLALIPGEAFGQELPSVRIPAVQIDDAPAFQYRGMFLDVGRNFHSVTAVKRLLDAMAFYKLNALHINLSQDEGWRVEIAGLPELTEVGGFRGHTLDDAEYLHPSYGSGPFPDPSSSYGSGFYSREQYIDLVRYAAQRHITVIPEINVPGHSRAAVKAMEARYRRLMAEGEPELAEQYRLVDPDENSTYRSAQWYTDNVINVCRESAYTFITAVLDAMIDMHDAAGAPLRVYPTGGDEVPRGSWTGSPLCADYLRENPEVGNPRNLQKVYFRWITEYLMERDIRVAGWEEIAMTFTSDSTWIPNDEFAAVDALPYVWNSLWGDEDLGNRLANAGYDVILANVTNFYFDLAYNKDPREPGLYWGGFINTRDAFEFVPFDLFRSIRVDPSGAPYTDARLAGKEKLTDVGRTHILGLQAQLWSETIRGVDRLEYYYLPKMLGLAERAWYGQAPWGDIDDRQERDAAIDVAWNAFTNAVSLREFPRLDRMNGGYNYRLASPGVIIDDGRMTVNTAYPGLVVRYTTDGSMPTVSSPLYTAPVAIAGTVIMASTFDSRGRASLPTVAHVDEE